MTELTHDEITTVISRFSGSMIKLESSGDYPERKTDKIILRKLLDLQWLLRKQTITEIDINNNSVQIVDEDGR